MAVDSTSAAYDLHLPLWHKMRAVSAGEEAVKDAGEAFLPMLGGQDSSEYGAYKERASFLNATARTIDGLSGMLFRKPPAVEHPTAMDDFMDDVDGAGLPFQSFAEGVVEDILTVSRGGILVDFPRGPEGELTEAQAMQEGRRPFWTWYKAEAILDYRVSTVANRSVVTQVRLKEIVEEPSEEFETVEVEQIRVLDLAGVVDDEGEPTGAVQYMQRVFRQDDTGVWVEFGDPIVPVIDGSPLDRIPFVFIGPRDLLPRMAKPILLDLANKNLDHYRLDADYHHGLHFVALPTPWAKGIPASEIEEGNFKAIGPTNIWLTTSENAEFGMLEFEGTGIEAIKQALERAEGAMAMLGARMLAPEKRQVEAAETANIHRMGENSVLSSIAQSVSSGLTKAMEWAALWMGLNETEVSVELNRDFMPAPMTPQALESLMKAWQAGGISKRTLFENLQKGEVISAERSFDDEEAEIETEGGLGDLVALAGAAE